MGMAPTLPSAAPPRPEQRGMPAQLSIPNRHTSEPTPDASDTHSDTNMKTR